MLLRTHIAVRKQLYTNYSTKQLCTNYSTHSGDTLSRHLNTSNTSSRYLINQTCVYICDETTIHCPQTRVQRHMCDNMVRLFERCRLIRQGRMLISSALRGCLDEVLGVVCKQCPLFALRVTTGCWHLESYTSVLFAWFCFVCFVT